MAVPRMTDSELLFSVAGVARMMNVPKEAVRDAIRHKRLRAEMILIGDRIGISIPLSAMAEFWNMPSERVRTIEAEAGQGGSNAPALVLTPIISRGRELGSIPDGMDLRPSIEPIAGRPNANCSGSIPKGRQ